MPKKAASAWPRSSRGNIGTTIASGAGNNTHCRPQLLIEATQADEDSVPTD